MTLITHQDALDSLCTRLASADFITVDTEFLREHTYYSKLCLIQVADDDGAFAIDPLVGDLDLAPFYDLMANEAVLKVLHACRQDIEIFFHASGAVPTPVFDTQIAAMVCGFGESAGYETLVGKILGRSIDKSTRYTDWSQRPLSDQQLNYALSDVTHLRDIYRHLMKDIHKTSRASWIDEEMAICTAPETYHVDPHEQWMRLKPRTNKPRMLGVLREITAWREVEAQNRDMPKRRVLKDETLLEIAARPPKSTEQLSKLRSVPNGMERSRAGKGLMDAIERGLNLPEDDLPTLQRARHRPATPPIADLIKVLLKIKCQKAKVAPKMVANTAEIEAWAAEPERGASFMKGWRYDIFGRDAEKMLAGNLALASDNGAIEIVELEPAEEA